MNKLLRVLFFGLISFSSFSQGEEFSIHYLNNPFLFNPAIAGTEDYGEVSLGTSFNTLGLRTLYGGYKSDAVRNSKSSYHHKREHASWHSWGLNAFASENSGYGAKGFVANYAYNVNINKQYRLSLGVKGGLDHLEHSVSNHDDWLVNFGGGFHFYSDKYAVSFSTNGSKELISYNEKTFVLGSYPLFISALYRIPFSRRISFVPQWVSLINVYQPDHLAVLKLDYQDQITVSALFGAADDFYWGINAGYVLNRTFELKYQLRKKEDFLFNEVVLKYRIRHRGCCPSTSEFW